MTAWHTGPLAGFDLETTGIDVETARIVTAAILERGPQEVNSAWLVNPGVEIPATASAIHGVTTELAQAEGIEARRAVEEISCALASVLLSGAPLVIYNAPYDLTVLDRECRRHGVTPFGDVLTGCAATVIDPFVLDKHVDPYRRGKRTLTAACAHYGVSLDEAHDSSADALAAMRVAWMIAARNPALAEMTPVELHDLQVNAKADQSASFEDYLRRQGKNEVVDPSWPYRVYADLAVTL